MAHIDLFTDGACSGNPGKGGYGLILVSGAHRKEVSQGYVRTTNNRMELLAVIVGLEMIKIPESEVHVYSDSKYVVDSVKLKWVFGWEKKGFAKRKNPDLWRRFLLIYRRHKVTFHWIKGHNDHPMNERCDELAVLATQQAHLLRDEGYEKEEKGHLF
jgi:ribonuclease HI